MQNDLFQLEPNVGYGDSVPYDEIIQHVENMDYLRPERPRQLPPPPPPPHGGSSNYFGFSNNRTIPIQPGRDPNRKGKARKGMTNLEDIVFGLKREFKHVTEALSRQGVDDIVARHNDKSPDNPWHAHYDDVNGDNIPDLRVHGAGCVPIIANGWTTKKSDYPMRMQYITDVPKSQRKELPYKQYKINKYGIVYDDNNADQGARGNVINVGAPYKEGWNVKGYQVMQKYPERMSPYDRFNRYVIQPAIEELKPTLIEAGIMSDDGKWPDRIAIVSKLTSKFWNQAIVNPTLADYNQYQQQNNRQPITKGTNDFKKWLRSKNTKINLDNKVTFELNKLNRVRNDGSWTEKQRAEYAEQLLNEILADIRTMVAQNAQ